MFEDFMKSLGFQQNDPNGLPLDSPGLTELIARLAQNLAPASHFIGGTRTPLGRTLGAASLIGGLGAGSIADQLQAQRNNPVAAQLRLANYIQQQGTAPTTANLAPYNLPPPPDAAAMTYAPVPAGQPAGFPGPRQGAPAFNVENLPPALSMVAQKLYPKLDPSEALKDEELKARTAYLQRQGNAPLAVPTGTELRDATGTTVIAPARLTEAQQQLEHNNQLYSRYATDVAAFQQAHPEMDRLQAADAVLNDPNKGYGELPETYGLVKSAKEWRTEQFKDKSQTERERFAQQQQNARESFSQQQENLRNERRLTEQAQPGLFADRETGLIGSITRGEYVADKKAGGTKYKPVSQSQADTVALLETADPMIKGMQKLAPVVLAKYKGQQMGKLIENALSHKMGTDPALQQFISLGAALSAEQARALSGSSRVLGGMFSVIRGESVPDYKVTADTAMRELSTVGTEMTNRKRSITGQKLEQFDVSPTKPTVPKALPKAPPSQAEIDAAKRLGIPLQ